MTLIRSRLRLHIRFSLRSSSAVFRVRSTVSASTPARNSFSASAASWASFAPGSGYVVTSAVVWLPAAAAFVTESPDLGKLSSALIPILYCGLISGGVGYTLQIVGQKNLHPTVASLLMSLESAFAVLGGWLILREKLSRRELLGCGLMLAAVLLVQLTPSKDKETAA